MASPKTVDLFLSTDVAMPQDGEMGSVIFDINDSKSKF